jgi:ABC-type Fe3+/spermidine/putrescine transport system ATPase subunit
VGLTLHNVRRAFAATPVLRGVDLALGQGEIVCLLGASGCGKTTLLRIIAGLETADTGDVRLDGESILGVPVHARGFGLMFQDFALFPHLDVAGNVGFGLKMQGVALQERVSRVREALARVNLPGFERRDVARLSGGERQRVALARSLAPNPRLLMLDEPLGSLDAALRDELIVDLRAIIKAAGLTTLYVTHDQREAFAIADRIAVMNAGIIEQIAAPTTLYRAPATEFVARFLGMANIVPVSRYAEGIAHTPLGSFALSTPAHSLLLHPDGIHLAAPDDTSALHLIVEEAVFQGAVYRLRARHASGIALTFALAAHEMGGDVHVGEVVRVKMEMEKIIGLRTEGFSTSDISPARQGG